jgi:isopentenyl-diphosphate Delta-isomerase
MGQALVEIVDERGATTGAGVVDDVHAAPGVWHRAFSVVVAGSDGLVLLQRRAGAKSRFPHLWANTCCGHVRPGVPLVDQARTRVREELGLHLGDLTEVSQFRYEAACPASIGDGTSGGTVERELDHVLVATMDARSADVPLRPDPAEVAGVAWVSPDDERRWPQPLAPWAAAVLRLARQADGSRPFGGSPRVQ